MIEVVELQKSFGPVPALASISFEVGRGEIVGLLGPNGAGKTTCMRVLAGFLRPGAGRVRVAGLDMRTQALRARSRVGYLPEGSPLPPELRVGEYLGFRARLRGIGGKERNERVERCLAQCGLAEAGRQIIGSLSRGYRQRVGLADALLGDPELLILDEPTTGLDPNQQRDVRDLIRRFAGDKTVLLSSHRLSEVSAVCDRVLIINGGKLVAVGPVGEVCGAHGLGAVLVEVRAPAAELAALLEQHAESVVMERHGSPGDADLCRCRLDGSLDDASIERIVAAIHQSGWQLRSLHRDGDQLEQVFALLTAPRVEGDGL